MPDFQLSAQLKGHTSDVRCVSFPAQDTVFSGSRDETFRFWRKTASKPPKFEDTTLNSGQGYVNSVTFLRPSKPASHNGLVIHSGAEPIIDVRNPLSPQDNSSRLLLSHSNNVCTLDTSSNGAYIVSGGWDGKAFVWDTNTWEPVKDLDQGDEKKSVWAVLAFSDDLVITGSADTRIRIFNLRVNTKSELAPQRVIQTEDVVRALCKLPTDLKGQHPSGAQFASGGNDGIIRLWKINGQQVGTLHGHDSFIYSLACLSTGEIVSSGEDRTLRIWRGSECIQTITHPAISVWAVSVCPENGDIVSGASDGVVRIFTRNAERTADPKLISEFEESVRTSAIPSTSINREKLDTKAWLQIHTGKTDGQVKMIKEEDGSVSAYQWSLAKLDWIHVGTVVESGASSGRKVSYNGKEYDYVFDVDIEEGKPTLKLPYNLSEDTYQAATRFLNDNDLPISYIEAVAKFISENTKATTIGETIGEEPTYRPDSEPTAPNKSVSKYLPHTEYLSLTQGRLAPAFNKLKEFNSKHIVAGNKHISMNPDDLSRLEALLVALEKAREDEEPPKIPNPNESKRIVLSLITQWPYSNRLPALDILRCIAVTAEVASHTDRRYGNLINVALRGALDTKQPIEDGGLSLADFLKNKVDWSQVNQNNLMMALRTVANLFVTPEGLKFVAEEAGSVIGLMGRIIGVEGQVPVSVDHVGFYTAVTTVAFNYACLAYNEPGTVELGLLAQLLSIAETVIRKQKSDEVLFRALMATGMIIAGGSDSRELANALAVREWLGVAEERTEIARIREVSRECSALLRR